MENIGEKRMDMISKWEEKSRDFIDAFLLLFGREGRLVCACKCVFMDACFSNIQMRPFSQIICKLYKDWNFLFIFVVNNLE